MNLSQLKYDIHINSSWKNKPLNMTKKQFFNIIALSSLMFSLIAPAQAKVSGRIREKGTRKPMENVNVFILPDRLKTTTNEEGKFSFDQDPKANFSIVVNVSGYKKLEIEKTLEESNSPLELYVEKNSYLVYETTVFGKNEKRDETIKSLNQKQILQMPGAGGDPIRAVQNLPGVARPQAFNAQVNIQGSGPQDTKYLVNGHNVPQIFHFGGLSSVVMPEAIDSIDLYYAGYGPEFGKASSGLVGIITKKPRTDRLHGLGYVDIFNAGALVEGPTSEKSSFLFSIRKSYVGEVLRTVFKNNENFNLTVAPSFTDSTGIYSTEINSKNTFKVTTLASDDKLNFVLKQPVKQDPSIRGNFESAVKFYRLMPELTHRHSDRTISRYSIAGGQDSTTVINADNYFYLRVWAMTARGEVERKMSDEWTSFLGFDNQYNWAKVRVRFPSFYNAGGVPNPISSGEIRATDVHRQAAFIGAYNRNTLRFNNSRWTFMPNVRFDYYNITEESLIQPRPSVKYALNEYMNLRGAWGIYYQPPEFPNVDPTFGNPDIASPYAIHYTAGAEKDFRKGSSDGVIASIDGFYKDLKNQIIPSSKRVLRGEKYVFENVNNDGVGKVYGAQSQIRYEFNPWSVSLNYTISKSTRTQPGQPEYPFQYDQTHNVGLLGSYETGNWRYSSRFRYATGNPYTSVTGATWDADADTYIPRRGPYYAERNEPFYQLDFRVDKKWVYDTWILSVYLDIQNITNRTNSEAIVYSYDYSKKGEISGLPILPTLGVKGEF